MDFRQLLILSGGVFNLAFAIFHLFFWHIFKWQEDLASLRYVNRGIMQIMNLCLTFIFIVFAYISFFHSLELLQTSLGKTILIAISLFWFLRMIEQLIFFGLKKMVSVVFTILFLLGGLIYLIPASF